MIDRCQWKKCHATGNMTWLERHLCWRHWGTVCALREEGYPAKHIRLGFTIERKPEKAIGI